MLSEQEATKKRCPMATPHVARSAAADPSPSAVDRLTQEIRAATRCVASACMWWRWTSSDQPGASDRRGYCGGAGRPEVAR